MDTGILVEWSNRIEWHEAIGSTNDRARELAREDVGHGFLVGADEQTAGRGRKGSEWESAPRLSLTFSVVLRPNWPRERWGWISLAAGLAVSEALEGMGFQPAIKWPNDILLGDRKTCGILIETEHDAAVAGIGINVNEERFAGCFEATSLRMARGSGVVREEVLAAAWKALMVVTERSIEEISEAVWERLAWRDEEVRTAAGKPARIRAFGPNGELVVESEGKLVHLSEADSLRRG